MKAMILREYGSSAEFQPVDLPQPAIKPGHVLVRVAATSVNTVDTMIRQMGRDLPLSPALPALLGMDFAGTIEAVGEGVTGFAAGDEVYGCAGGLADLPGALAQFILADARLIARKPKSLSMREAAALPLVGITAYEGLHRHPWAWLLQRVFAVDVMTCPRCRGAMKLIDIANEREAIARVLATAGLGPRPPPRPRPPLPGQLELKFAA